MMLTRDRRRDGCTRTLRTVLASSLKAAMMLCAAACGAQPANSSTVRTAPAADLRALHTLASSLLPSGAQNAQFQDKQAVLVSGSSQVTVLPVSLRTPVPDAIVEGQMRTQCGVLVSQGASARLVLTLGSGNTEMMTCVGIKAVGGTSSANADRLPDLILIYDAYTGRETFPATILLTWDARRGTYAVDDASSQWLGEQKDGKTVADARRLLAMRRHS